MLTNFPVAPPSASSYAGEYDLIFYALVALTLIFTFIVGFGVLWFVVKYRKGTYADRSRPIYEDLRLELSWTIIPLILGLVMFFFGAKLFVTMRVPPADAQEIFVIGKQWMWHVQHSNGVRENNTLHVPVGKPVKLTMISQDVIHAFYIPAFRAQMHVVPGRYSTMWFTPTKVGKYHLFCTMYCGTQHSEMGGSVVVMEQKEWAEWIANGGQSTTPMTMAQAGQKIYNQIACNNCHGPEDNLRAPTLVGLYGSKRRLADGTSVIADETYIRESILRPHNRLSAGYGRTMPAYDGQITEADALKLIAYIKTMGGQSNENPSSPVSIGNIPVENSGTTPTPMAAGAMRYQTERTDATPTTRGSNPAVGAIAAQEGADNSK